MGGGARLPIEFVQRAEILAPSAVVGIGPSAHRLARRLLQHDDAQLREWLGVAGHGAIVLLGSDLPWVDGVSYLGREPAAPRLLLPTHLRPAHVPLDVFEQALLARVSAQLAPSLAVTFSPRRILSVAHALPVQRQHLRAWLEPPQ